MSKYTLVQHVNTASHHYRLRFGTAYEVIKLENDQWIYGFNPHQTFGYVRWCRNNYGTVSWQLYICKTVRSGRVSRVPGVRPGAEILLHARGKDAVRRTLSCLANIEKFQAISLENIPASFWRKSQNAREVRQTVPVYAPTI